MMRYAFSWLLLFSSTFCAWAAVDFASPDDCRDVCRGTFAFPNISQAELCCQLTRPYYEQEEGETEAPTEAPPISNATRGSAGVSSSCNDYLGGPKGSRVRVRYATEDIPLDQCWLCIGATAEGDEQCGMPPPTAAPISAAVGHSMNYWMLSEGALFIPTMLVIASLLY